MEINNKTGTGNKSSLEKGKNKEMMLESHKTKIYGVYKGIISVSIAIISILSVLGLKSSLLTKMYIEQMSKINNGYIEISVIGIIGLIYILFHVVLLVVMTVILIHLIRSYYKRADIKQIKKINTIVFLIIVVLIAVTSVADISDVLGLQKIGTKLGMTHQIIFFFLVRIPSAIMNTSTLVILSVMIFYSIKLYRKFSVKGERFSIFFSVCLGITGYISTIFILNVLEIQQLVKSQGKIINLSESIKVFKLYFINNTANMKEILNHQNILGIIVIILTGIFILVQSEKEKQKKIIF